MLWHFFLHVTGIDNPSGHWYAFWSGFVGDLPLFGVFALLARRFNCHAKGCWRLGLHRVSGTHFVTCRHHHPSLNGHHTSAEDIREIHRVVHEVRKP